jgi:AraC-like DNA-binding protein
MQRSLTAASIEDLAQNGHGYTEWAPAAALADRVVCVWVDAARDGRPPVLPDACIDLVWDGHALNVAGPDTRAVPLVDSSTTFVGVRFRPGAAPGFLGLPASELVDARVDLREVWGRPAEPLAGALYTRPASAIDLLQQALIDRRAGAAAPDPLVRGLLSELAGSSGRSGTRASVSALADSLGVSHRTLRRRCTEALGYGPKTLERILRFRRALRLLRADQPLALVAHLAGYVDQAHLTNESRRLANTTPAAVQRGHPTLPISTNGCD